MKIIKRFETAYSSCLVAEDDQGPLVLYKDHEEKVMYLYKEIGLLEVKLKSLAIQSDIMINALKTEIKKLGGSI